MVTEYTLADYLGLKFSGELAGRAISAMGLEITHIEVKGPTTLLSIFTMLDETETQASFGFGTAEHIDASGNDYVFLPCVNRERSVQTSGWRAYVPQRPSFGLT